MWCQLWNMRCEVRVLSIWVVNHWLCTMEKYFPNKCCWNGSHVKEIQTWICCRFFHSYLKFNCAELTATWKSQESGQCCVCENPSLGIVCVWVSLAQHLQCLGKPEMLFRCNLYYNSVLYLLLKPSCVSNRQDPTFPCRMLHTHFLTVCFLLCLSKLQCR